MDKTNNPIIVSVQNKLGVKKKNSLPPRPPILPSRKALDSKDEIQLFIEEIKKLSGNAEQLNQDDLPEAINRLIHSEDIKKATLWKTPLLENLAVANILKKNEIEVIPCDADKNVIAACDLGVTEADFIIPYTGTIGLVSDRNRPRSVSLLPRVHLSIIRPSDFRSDLHDVFRETMDQNYLVLITGPSRTADIELTVALGVHGPKSLYAWILPD